MRKPPSPGSSILLPLNEVVATILLYSFTRASASPSSALRCDREKVPLLELALAPCLLLSRFRPAAIAAAALFHLVIAVTFRVGWFSEIMLVFLLYLEPARGSPRPDSSEHAASQTIRHSLFGGLMFLHTLFLSLAAMLEFSTHLSGGRTSDWGSFPVRWSRVTVGLRPFSVWPTDSFFRPLRFFCGTVTAPDGEPRYQTCNSYDSSSALSLLHSIKNVRQGLYEVKAIERRCRGINCAAYAAFYLDALAPHKTSHRDVMDFTVASDFQCKSEGSIERPWWFAPFVEQVSEGNS